jgi:hypothetical protein
VSLSSTEVDPDLNLMIASMIGQKSSWGRLGVSKNAFKMILASHRVFVPFLDVVHAYGSKTDEEQHNWKGHRWNLSREDPDSTSSAKKYGWLFPLLN